MDPLRDRCKDCGIARSQVEDWGITICGARVDAETTWRVTREIERSRGE